MVRPGSTTSSRPRAQVLETFEATSSGVIRRIVLTRDGREVTSVVGRSRHVVGERIEDRADLAYLSASAPPPFALGVRTIRALDLYSGCGGLSLGVLEACRALGLDFEAVPVDVDRAALDIFTSNIPTKLAYRASAPSLANGRRRELTPREQRLRREIGKIDILLAGPPCQGFTALNNHTRGDDPRNDLYSVVARFAYVFRPRHVLIENVTNVRHDVDGVVAKTIRALIRLNYNVTEDVVPMVALGVPQLRKRHIIVATRGPKAPVKQIAGMFIRNPRSLGWALSQMRRGGRPAAFDRAALPSKDNRRRMKWLRSNRAYDLPNSKRPVCHQGAHSYVSMYGRLRWTLPAQTITSGFGSMGQGRYVHPKGYRTLTPHEAARIQFFPDWFDFRRRRRTEWSTAIGNAVPMKLGYAYGLWLLR